MAHADVIAPELLRKVADELSSAVERQLPTPPLNDNANFMTGMPARDVEKATLQLHLCETFAVWKLQTKSFEAIKNDEGCGDIYDCAEPTKLLYHQVRQRGKLVGFARSLIGDNEGATSLSQYNISPLAAAVDRAIEIIDDNEAGDQVAASDPVVRMLEVPSHHVVALWLYSETLGESRSIIVKAPKLRMPGIGYRLLTSAEFFKFLKESGLVRAIT